jgi:eukaryotic-like serine/threonine-protein kinase
MPSSEPHGGSSDGQTCEQARAGYVEEMTVGAASQQDLSADDFAAVLNQGAYLDPCTVPAASKLRICAAVQNGRAVGVTVATTPANADVEICVAKQVRNLSFPTHVKMDVVTVRF